MRPIRLLGCRSTANLIWGNTVSQLHFDGTNGSTTITDKKGLPWVCNGNAQLSTTSQQFGTAALLLDGSGDYVASGEAASTFKFLHDGSKYTLEFFARPTAAASGTEVFLETTIASASIGMGIYRTAANAVCVDVTKGTSGVYAARLASSNAAISNGAYAHIALVHDPASASGNKLRLYVAGTKVASGDMTSPSSSAPTNPLNFGRYIAGNSLFYNGRLDEFRAVRGMALYDANFTPPAAPFPDS